MLRAVNGGGFERSHGRYVHNVALQTKYESCHHRVLAKESRLRRIEENIEEWSAERDAALWRNSLLCPQNSNNFSAQSPIIDETEGTLKGIKR